MATNAIGIFLTKLQDWKYCPPSDHLWTITFEQYNPGTKKDTEKTHGFKELYTDIERANNNFTQGHGISQLYDAGIQYGNDNNATFVVNAQDSTIGFFLATDVQFTVNEITVADQLSSSEIQYSGFINYGKALTGKQHNLDAKINFYKSNWDINELLFDRWIAAVGRQGLIESSDLPNIKARIIISEYAAGQPDHTAGTWALRKQIILHKAFPKSREAVKLSYEPGEAGAFKTSVVTFDFSAYTIKYPDKDIPATGGFAVNANGVPSKLSQRSEPTINAPR